MHANSKYVRNFFANQGNALEFALPREPLLCRLQHFSMHSQLLWKIGEWESRVSRRGFLELWFQEIAIDGAATYQVLLHFLHFTIYFYGNFYRISYLN